MKKHRVTKVSIRKAAPTVLTIVGAVGVISTAILAAKATPKAVELIEMDSRENHGYDPHAATMPEAVKSCWRCYIPAAITGLATIGCMFAANAINRKHQVAVAGAYALLARSFDDYKRKVVELHGKETHDAILRELAAERAKDRYITAYGAFRDSSLDFEGSEENPVLFYDVFSKRFFESTFSKVLQAEYHTNRNFAIGGGEIGVNDFYDFLGIDRIEKFNDFGWCANDEYYWIDFNHNHAVVDDGITNDGVDCYVIEFVHTPTNDWSWD